jgi:hypothetical protein
MDNVLRGWAIGYLLGHTINRHREARPHWAAVAYSHPTGMAWSSNHRSAHAAETGRPGPLSRPAGSTVRLRNQHHHRRGPRPPRWRASQIPDR